MFGTLRSLFSKIGAWISPRKRADVEFANELEGHLDLLTQENLRRGMAPAEAGRAARIRLGGATQLVEIHRETRGLPLLDTLWQDVRYAFRVLRKNPGFTAVCVLTLALGIGANTAIFSVVYAVALKPLPYPDSQQLFTIFQQRAQKASDQAGISYLNLQDLLAQNTSFSGMTGVTAHELTMTGHGDPFIVRVADVTANLFTVFEQQPILGRVFRADDGTRTHLLVDDHALQGLAARTQAYFDASLVRELGGDKARPNVLRTRRRGLLRMLPRMMIDAALDAIEERERRLRLLV